MDRLLPLVARSAHVSWCLGGFFSTRLEKRAKEQRGQRDGRVSRRARRKKFRSKRGIGEGRFLADNVELPIIAFR